MIAETGQDRKVSQHMGSSLAHNPRLQPIYHMGKSWPQEDKTARHIISTEKTTLAHLLTCLCSAHFLLFYMIQDPLPRE